MKVAESVTALIFFLFNCLLFHITLVNAVNSEHEFPVTEPAMSVIVIGSGAAGLAAMRRLYEAGINAVCLEAADRIGGRVNTVPYADGVVDLGAMVLEGEKGNTVTEMLKPLGIIESVKPESRWFVLSNGELLPKEVAGNFSNKLDTWLNETDKLQLKSAPQFLRESLKSDTTLQLDPALKTGLLDWYERLHEYAGQTDPKKGKSLPGLKERWGCEGQLQGFKGKGLGQVLDVLLNKIPDPSKALPLNIQLNKEVDSIKWKTDSGLVKVVCKDGSVFEAKSVICTSSVGLLKERHSTLFDPALSAEKVKVIDGFEMLVLDKIYMEFTTPWWKTTPAGFSVIWKPEDAAKFSADEKWITGVYGMDTVDGQPNVLLAWINDEAAKHMEKTSEADVKKGMEKLLDLTFKDKFAPTPIKTILRTNWFTNRWARGSYSYRSVYSEESRSSADELATPLVDNKGFPVVCFGGEATAPHYHAAVHGAVDSGFREADRIIKLLK